MTSALMLCALLVSGCGYEALPLSKDSPRPAFTEEIRDLKELNDVYFRWSDWGAAPNVTVKFVSSNGATMTKQFPMTEWEWATTGSYDRIYITVLNNRQLFEHVPNTAPRELRVASGSGNGKTSEPNR